MMTLTDREKRTVQGVFGELLKMRYTDLNGFLGSVTIEEMQQLYSKMRYSEWCERAGIRFEDMTDEDYEQAALEMQGA